MAKWWNLSARWSLVAAAAQLVIITPAPAQTVSAQPQSIDSTPVCMVSKLRDVAQVPAENRGKPLRIVVAAADVPALTGDGFEVTDCKKADLELGERRAAWRDGICELAATGNEAVQNQLERALGVRPAVLCGSAEFALGSWKGKGKPKND